MDPSMGADSSQWNAALSSRSFFLLSTTERSLSLSLYRALETRRWLKRRIPSRRLLEWSAAGERNAMEDWRAYADIIFRDF
jgi:hypothetical protein